MLIINILIPYSQIHITPYKTFLRDHIFPQLDFNFNTKTISQWNSIKRTG